MQNYKIFCSLLSLCFYCATQAMEKKDAKQKGKQFNTPSNTVKKKDLLTKKKTNNRRTLKESEKEGRFS